ncbi:MAG: hypothetical protein ISQ90_06005 [Rhodospirillales bacterium]|nr:hypothetical protein [Rhodospirillales bacterium]
MTHDHAWPNSLADRFAVSAANLAPFLISILVKRTFYRHCTMVELRPSLCNWSTKFNILVFRSEMLCPAASSASNMQSARPLTP